MRLLFSDVRQEPHESRALHGRSQLALVLRAYTGAAAVDHAAMRVQETAQELGVLVIDVPDIMLAEITLFFHCSVESLERDVVGIDAVLRIFDGFALLVIGLRRGICAALIALSGGAP